jgi:hypothetical protein
MNSDNKKIISVRASQPDLDKVKAISQRLRVRESKLLRFAIKIMLGRLGPLHDIQVNGRDLMPVFADFGEELTRYFELDQARLEEIINGGVSDRNKIVDSDDIALMAMGDMPEAYRYMKLKELSGKAVDRNALSESIREYIADKYVNVTTGRENPV